VSVVTPLQIAGDFVVAVVGGVGVGFAVGFILATVRKFVHAPVLDTSLSLVTPYIAFLGADLIHGSGVLAVVVAGLYLGYRSPAIQSAEARIAESVNWRTIQFLLENAVFLFIGLNVAGILERALRGGPGLWQTLWICVAIFLALGVARFAWIAAATIVYRHGPARLRERGWSWATSIVVSFAGIRGVVTLAAVFLLPEAIPNREFLQFLAFVVVVGSLVAGLALPSIIRHFKLPSPDLAQEGIETQRLMAEAQTAGVLRLEEELSDDDEERVIQRLRANAGFLADALDRPSRGEEPLPATYRRLRRLMLDAERTAVLTARAERRYQEHAVRAALASIDAEETALKASAPKRPGSELT
jgi:CPA1 family monovalent cation:H+ antiporter